MDTLATTTASAKRRAFARQLASQTSLAGTLATNAVGGKRVPFPVCFCLRTKCCRCPCDCS
eukprot:10903512-Alexandrium_andersonii.AAC.1